jgi:membrane fusion protein (multidrug efflux system)
VLGGAAPVLGPPKERSLIRRHFFLVGAVAVLALVLLAGGLKLLLTPQGPGGGGSAMAQGAGGPGGGGPGGRRGGPGGGRGAPVTLVAAVNRTFSDRIDVIGVAKGRQSVTITSSTAELARRVLFRDGQYVRTGQVLVELDSREQDADIAQAQVRLVQALRDNERWQELARRGVAPRATAEQYAAAYQTARASLAAAQARRLDRVIRAPFSGVVGLSDIAPGALISPGAPIVTLDDISVIRVDFQVPDRYIAAIHPGMTIVARPESYPDIAAPGSIALLDTRIDERTRAITARAEIPNPTGRLLPGMMVRVGVEQSTRQSVALPESAVQFEGDQAFVFVVTRGQQGMQAHKRQVTIGLNQDGFIEIRQGLRPGEQTVADGLNRVQDGQPVFTPGAGGPGGRQGGGRPGGQGGAPRPGGARQGAPG